MKIIPSWPLDRIKKEALKYKRRMDFRTNSQQAYKAAIALNSIDEVCNHMIHPKTALKPMEELKKIALKYKTRGSFHDFDKSIYECARVRGILDEICSHMPNHIEMAGENSPLITYSLEEIIKESLKYKTRGEFQKNNVNMYMVAQRRKLLEKVCSHMKFSSDTSIAERELFAIIKEKYPSAKKIRDMNVKIEGKPYIKGFEIDIFIPELNKGIEFDGKYWHSFKGLSSSRKKKGWLNEDIENYHKIKDSYFASKHIQIIHINEIEWINSKEECVKKCFNFIDLTKSIIANSETAIFTLTPLKEF